MSTQPVRRLSQLEIDEVSLVDRPANQHGLVTITKRDEGTGMFFDENGNPVDETELQSGDVVFDQAGQPIQLFSDEDLESLLESGQIDEDDLIDERELATVGKSAGASAVTGGSSSIFQTGRKIANRHLGDAKLGWSDKGGHLARGGHLTGAGKVTGHVSRNRTAYTAATAAGAEENARGRFRKSLGEEVLSELSKALTDNDQHQIISKVAQRLEENERATEAAISKAQQLEAQAEFAEYCEVAKGFELPVETDELGDLLYTVSKSLSDSQLDLFERILHTASAAVAAELQEIGSAGYSPTMGYVGEVAQEVVGKSAGELTEAQATVALMSANPDVYLDYLSENQR